MGESYRVSVINQAELQMSSPNPFINLRRSLKDAKDCREEMFIREGRKWKIWTTTHMCPIKNCSSTIGGRAQKNRLIISDISLVKKWAQRVTVSTKITQKAMKFSPPFFLYSSRCLCSNLLSWQFPSNFVRPFPLVLREGLWQKNWRFFSPCVYPTSVVLNLE